MMHTADNGYPSVIPFIPEAERITAASEPKQQLLEAGFDKVVITRSGQELFEDRPEVLESFAQLALHQLGPEGRQFRTQHRSDLLGIGRSAGVYEQGPDDDYCIKVSTPDISRDGRTSNLTIDLRFMNLIHRRLAARADEYNVHAPQHYAAVRLTQNHQKGYALLERKLPAGLVSLKDLFNGMSKDEFSEAFEEVSETVKRRSMDAIGSHTLMLGINDLMIGKIGADAHMPNGGNVWIDPADSIKETPVHIIDLVRNGGISRRAAHWLGCLAA